jgi:hypothetical protein
VPCMADGWQRVGGTLITLAHELWCLTKLRSQGDQNGCLSRAGMATKSQDRSFALIDLPAFGLVPSMRRVDGVEVARVDAS